MEAKGIKKFCCKAKETSGHKWKDNIRMYLKQIRVRTWTRRKSFNKHLAADFRERGDKT